MFSPGQVLCALLLASSGLAKAFMPAAQQQTHLRGAPVASLPRSLPPSLPSSLLVRPAKPTVNRVADDAPKPIRLGTETAALLGEDNMAKPLSLQVDRPAKVMERNKADLAQSAVAATPTSLSEKQVDTMNNADFGGAGSGPGEGEFFTGAVGSTEPVAAWLGGAAGEWLAGAAGNAETRVAAWFKGAPVAHPEKPTENHVADDVPEPTGLRPEIAALLGKDGMAQPPSSQLDRPAELMKWKKADSLPPSLPDLAQSASAATPVSVSEKQVDAMNKADFGSAGSVHGKGEGVIDAVGSIGPIPTLWNAAGDAAMRVAAFLGHCASLQKLERELESRQGRALAELEQIQKDNTGSQLASNHPDYANLQARMRKAREEFDDVKIEMLELPGKMRGCEQSGKPATGLTGKTDHHAADGETKDKEVEKSQTPPAQPASPEEKMIVAQPAEDDEASKLAPDLGGKADPKDKEAERILTSPAQSTSPEEKMIVAQPAEHAEASPATKVSEKSLAHLPTAPLFPAFFAIVPALLL